MTGTCSPSPASRRPKRLKRLPRGFVLVCVVSSVLAGQSPPAAKAPLLVVPNGDAGPWQAIARDLGWQLFTPSVANIAGDKGLQDFENATRAAIARPQVDDTRVYLLGNAADTPAIFYIVSRWPEPWAAAVALGGTPRPAIDSNRLFGINTRL